MRLMAVAAALPLLTACVATIEASPNITADLTACAPPAKAMNRVELIFGLRRAQGIGGEGVTEAEWYDFLETEVTPRFPDGLTAFDGYGQWKRPDGRIARIASKVLLTWYDPAPDAEAKIEAVREAFKKRFEQLSVMRVDGRDCVAF
jgi:hypothetical protein